MLILAGCGGDNTNNSGDSGNTGGNNGGTTTAADAETVYKANCVSCHGADLNGYDLNTVGARMSKEEIEKQIKNGGGGMPGFGNRLDAAEVTALVDWLAEKK